MVLVMTTIMMKIILTNLAGCSSLPTPGSWLVHTEQLLERLNTTCLAISTNFYASILLRVKLCTRIGPAATADKVWQFPQTYFDKYSFCWVLDLLILPVLESVDEGVDCGRHPSEHAGDKFVMIFGINNSVELIWAKVSVKYSVVSINTDIYQPGNDVDGGEGDVIVNDVDQHQGQEADQEGDEDGQHHLCQPEVLYRQ